MDDEGDDYYEEDEFVRLLMSCDLFKLAFRAEEHLPKTLRQALIYKALGFQMPDFAHVSLILAPDRSKLSKRHGATSVGQYREMGYLPQAMVNYLALLGWDDGTENEFFTLEKLVEKFTVGRINKSGAIFDSTKLRWMNGQHLRALPSEELTKLIGEQWKCTGLLTDSEGLFVETDSFIPHFHYAVNFLFPRLILRVAVDDTSLANRIVCRLRSFRIDLLY